MLLPLAILANQGGTVAHRRKRGDEALQFFLAFAHFFEPVLIGHVLAEDLDHLGISSCAGPAGRWSSAGDTGFREGP